MKLLNHTSLNNRSLVYSPAIHEIKHRAKNHRRTIE